MQKFSPICSTLMLTSSYNTSMDDTLGLAWLVLYMSAYSVVLLAPRFSSLRATNRMLALFATISLLLSFVFVPFIFTAWTEVIIGVVSAYLIANIAILWMWRFHAHRTRNVVMRNQLGLGMFFCGALVSILVLPPGYEVIVQFLISLMVSAYVLVRILQIYVHHSPRATTSQGADAKQPSVSFAVPARNETHALTEHLQSIVKTNYPKIEFLVLDDCSQDDTSQIIRAFAQDGVRFIKGKQPDETWLGRNHAYQTLLEEAAGEYILFSGVDTRYEPESIAQVIDYMVTHNLNMVSLLPKHVAKSLGETILQPMRYLFMLLTSTPQHPPVLSTVWIARREFIASLGEFKACASSIHSEQYFANAAHATGSYDFIMSGWKFGISSRKRFLSQQETAVRTIYPQLGKSLSRHLLFMMLIWFAVLFPLTAAAAAPKLAALFLIPFTFVYLAYILVVWATRTNSRTMVSPLTFLFGVGFYIYLSALSVFRYETNQISWKDRYICKMVFESHTSNNL